MQIESRSVKGCPHRASSVSGQYKSMVIFPTVNQASSGIFEVCRLPLGVFALGLGLGGGGVSVCVWSEIWGGGMSGLKFSGGWYLNFFFSFFSQFLFPPKNPAGMHPRDGQCAAGTPSYWNAFLFRLRAHSHQVKANAKVKKIKEKYPNIKGNFRFRFGIRLV